MIKIFNSRCEDAMKSIEQNSVDIILTSPFYNTNKKAGKNTTLNNVVNSGYTHVRYDTLVDNMSNDEYCNKCVEWFNSFDKILKNNGVILWNVSYGSENPECMYLSLAEIIKNTNFTIADTIIWKKHTALPNNMSSNKCTRICEFVFVFCRKNESKTFYMNKPISSVRDNGQKNYSNVYNFIDAKNNDGSCKLNKATYSTEFCDKLLDMYGKTNERIVVYDPFFGTGTTGNSCALRGYDCIGSEISENQCIYAKERIEKNGVEVEILKI